MPPIFEIYSSASTLEWREVEPGGDVRQREGTETFIRPFGSFESSGPDRSRFRMLPPFIDFRWSPEENRYRILPVFRHQNRAKRFGGRDVDTMIFPLFFWGHDPEERGYFAFFPFGGTLEGLLGADRITFAMFPIWMRLDRDGRKSTHVLWPFINAVSGAGWSGGRFWPFFGHYLWLNENGEPRSERTFALWPFYIRASEFIDRDETEILWLFPFWGGRENERRYTRTILWPFYVYTYDKKHERSLHGGHAFPYRFSGGRDEGREQADYWPFWGTKSRVDEFADQGRRARFRQFALWPIQRYDRAEDDGESMRRWWILPFWYDFYRLDKVRLETERKWNLWPLMAYRKSGEAVAFDLFSPLWTDRVEFDRHYGRLFAIFRYRSHDPSGSKLSAWELLWGTLYHERRPAGWLFSVLGGILEVGNQSDRAKFRLLWIPWW